MKLSRWIPAAIAAVVLAACGRNEPPPLPEVPGFGSEADDPVIAPRDWSETVAAFETFAEEALSIEGASEADIAGVQAALPDWISLSWDEASFDSASGATTFSNLALTINTEPAFGLSMETARFWGLDGDFLAARLSGERLDETGKVFDRMEATSVRYFGIADALNALFETMLALEMDGAASEFNVQEVTVEADRLVIAGMSLRPFEYVPLSDEQFAALDDAMQGDELPPLVVSGTGDDEDEPALEAETDEPVESDADTPFEEADVIRIAQQAIAFGRTLSVDRGAAFGISARLDILSSNEVEDAAAQFQMNQVQEVKVDFYGYEGLRGFDIDQFIVANGREGQGLNMSGASFEEVGMDGFGFRYEQTYDFSLVESLKLDRLAGFLARSELPSMQERDLMSLGTWSTQGYAVQLNETDVFKADLVQFSAEDFAWLIPEKLSLDLKGVNVSVAEIGELVLDIIPSGQLSAQERAALVDVETAIGMLDDHGLATLPFDFSLRGTWDSDTGEAGFRLASTAEGFGDRLFRFGIRLPDYAQIEALNVSDEAFGPGFEALYDENFAFIGARYFESDEGGYDKLFGYLHALGGIYETEGWGATLAGMPPERLRGFISSIIRSGMGSLPKDYPQAADWLEAIAAYFETSGGSLDMRAEPGEPLTPDAIKMAAEEGDDEAWLDQFGISVTHTPE